MTNELTIIEEALTLAFQRGAFADRTLGDIAKLHTALELLKVRVAAVPCAECEEKKKEHE